jgi:hypothetical protein
MMLGRAALPSTFEFSWRLVENPRATAHDPEEEPPR